MQGNVNARQESFIKGFDSISGEEENTTVILDVAEAKRLVGTVTLP